MSGHTDHLRAALADLMRWIEAERLEAAVMRKH
jgi:hypothetical protein